MLVTDFGAIWWTKRVTTVRDPKVTVKLVNRKRFKLTLKQI